MLPLTLLKRCCTRYKSSNKFSFNSLAGVLGNRNLRGITFGYAARDHCFVIASINNTAIDPIAVASQTPPTRARLHRAARDLWLCDWLDGNK